MPTRPNNNDITVPHMKDNETWNSCPECHKAWRDEIPTPGLIHRLRICDKCYKEINKNNDHDSKGNERT